MLADELPSEPPSRPKKPDDDFCSTGCLAAADGERFCCDPLRDTEGVVAGVS